MFILQAFLLYFLVVDATTPSAPTNVNGTAESSTITLTWEAPEKSAKSEILYRSSDHNVSFTVRDLIPNTFYKFLISAENGHGEGPRSPLFVITTKNESAPPVLTLYPAKDSITVVPGQMINITCTATGEPEPEIKWKVDGVEKIRGRTLIMEAPSKSFHATCHAENDSGRKSRKVDIRVNEPPSPPEKINFTAQATSITLSWEASDRPSKTDILTYNVLHARFDHILKSHFNVTKVNSSGEVVFYTLEHLTPNTLYRFLLTAANDNGEGPKSPLLAFSTTKERVKPSIKIEPAGRMITIAHGSKTIINCTATGEPETLVKWVLDDGEVIAGGILDLTTFVDNRTAICYGENAAGNATIEISVIVEGDLHGSPANISIILKEDDITITWGPPKHPHGILTHYNFYLTRNSPRHWGPEYFNISDITNLSMHFFPGELERTSNYTIQVAAVYQNGEEVISRPRSFLTKRDEDGPPENIEVVSDGTTIYISWVVYELFDVIKGFNVQISSDFGTVVAGSENWKEIELTGNMNHCKIDMNLNKIPENTTYALKMAAIYENRKGMFSAITTFST